MKSLHFTGRSKQTAAQALELALQHAVAAHHGAAHTHVVIHDIIKTESGWIADLDVDIEPQKSRHAEKNIDLSDQDEKEDLVRKAEAWERRHQLSMETQKKEQEEKEKQLLKKHLEEQEALNEILAVYLELHNESIFRAIEHNFDFDYVHVIGSDSAWKEITRRQPDMDFYRAEHEPEDTAPKPPSKGDCLIPPEPRLDRKDEPSEELE